MVKKKKQEETGLDRLKKIPLWQWGLIVIFAGVFANITMGLMPPTGSAAARRGQQMGRNVASLFFLFAGIVMIIMHFVRKKRE